MPQHQTECRLIHPQNALQSKNKHSLSFQCYKCDMLSLTRHSSQSKVKELLI